MQAEQSQETRSPQLTPGPDHRSENPARRKDLDSSAPTTCDSVVGGGDPTQDADRNRNPAELQKSATMLVSRGAEA